MTPWRKDGWGLVLQFDRLRILGRSLVLGFLGCISFSWRNLVEKVNAKKIGLGSSTRKIRERAKIA